MQKDWNLQKLYNSENDPQIQKDIDESIQNIQEFVKKWGKNKEYTRNPAILKTALDDYEKLNNTTGICNKPIYYFILRSNLDQTNPVIKAKLNKLSDTCTKLENELQFFELKISKIAKGKQKEFLDYKGLKDYRHYLEHQFLLSKYTLSEKEEKIINLTSKTAYSNWVDMMSELLDKQQLTVIDENLQKVKINYNDTNKYLDSQNKKVRDYASKEYNKVNTRYTEIAEFEINSILERKRTLEEYRGIKRPDFPRHMSDDIETEVVDTLIKTVTDNFEISKRYYTKKAQLLGIKQLGYHERNVLMPNADVKYTYEQAMHIVGDVFNGIDLIFFNLFSDFEKSGAYDVFPKQGKTGGAFCISMNKSLPIYILLNFKDKLSDILTIAHETGHAIHYKLSGEQNSINYAPPTSLAEIASTFFEDFALSKILEDTKDDNAKTAILDMKLHGDISTIFRQVAFYNFEKDLHHDFNEKGFLTKEYISDLFCKHMHSYLGDAVKEDESMRNGWIYISHFRRPFYVYSYASGLLISKALQQMVKEDKKNISYVKTFLESGSSKSPKDLFMGMGIDITKKEFWEKGLSSTKELVEKL